MLAITNPTYLAGKTAYWLGVPSDSINHCAPDIVSAWLDGWNEARAEHMQLRSSIARQRGNLLPVDRDSVLQ